MTKPLILVTNDDGITSPGIKALVEVAQEFGEVVVVAPDKAQSGMGHAITLEDTLRKKSVNLFGDIEAYSCTGTPVDCVKLAVNVFLDRNPDLIISGINHGSNASVNVIYSGTMSAAVEGAMEHIPSIGFSLLDHSIDANFETSKKYVAIVIKSTLDNGLPEGVCLNVNFPKLGEAEIAGIKICRQCNGNWTEEFDARKAPSGKEYYWLTGVFMNYEPEATDTDIWALDNGFISIVPVHSDMTAYNTIDTLKNWKLG
ncbi:MAG: 5'/3'-nucleotidase SurE [Flavobacteriales bacterium]|nr:5'/3'-nucleotidase SurE [Flavobacteriales bacterium]